MQLIRSLLLVLCTIPVSAQLLSTRVIAQALPGEDQLPGQRRDSDPAELTEPTDSTVSNVQKPPQVDTSLPDETELPGGAKVATDTETDVGPIREVDPNRDADPNRVDERDGETGNIGSGKSPNDDVDDQQLPPEGELPDVPDDGPKPIVNSQQEPADPLELGQSPDEIPWLRLNFRGHTAQVRTIVFTPDGKRMLSAGDDKSVMVWRQDAGRWRHERTIRWRIQRGQSGRIHALAATNDLVAIAGHGAMSNVGEIILVDPRTGEQQAELFGHRQVVVSMSFSTGDNPSLASMDQNGRLLLWTRIRGRWRPQQLAFEPDSKDRLQLARRLHPIVLFDRDTVIAPAIAGLTEKGEPKWVVRKYRKDRRPEPIARVDDPEHIRLVTAMTIDRNARHLATADDAGGLYLWNLRTGEAPQRKQFTAPITSLSFDAAGELLALTTANTVNEPMPRLECFRLADLRKPLVRIEQKIASYACAMRPDEQQIAFGEGNAVKVRDVANNARPQILRANVRVPTRVAFPVESPYHHRIYFGTGESGNDGPVALEASFNTRTLQLETTNLPDDRQIVPPDWMRESWQVQRVQNDDNDYEYFLNNDGTRKARLPLRDELHGRPTCFCWIPNFDGQPYAVAVGTMGSGNIYVFKLADQGVCPLIRQFRGHEAKVNSIAVALNLSYLASASDDATIRFWSMDDLFKADLLINRWGAEFVDQDGKLVVASIRKDGPLYFRGIREGDVIEVVGYQENEDETVEYDRPRQMLQLLRNNRWDQTVLFRYSPVRGGQQKAFIMFPAWQQVASLFIDQTREWAYWAPSGYYAASFEGHKLFGWLVNRLAMAPDFFLAAQVQQALERPRVLAQLLAEGNLRDAFKKVDRPAPANASRSIFHNYQLKPRIVIHAPKQDDQIIDGLLTIEATVATPLGTDLIPPKAFANGVIAVNRKLLETKRVNGRRQSRFRWTLKPPSDRQLLVQVVAASDARVAETSNVLVQQRVTQPARPRLFIAAAGINEYRDGQVPSLKYGVDNAKYFSRLLETRSSPLYRTRAVSLQNTNVTRAVWSATMDTYVEALKREVSADDVLVLFLSGHGVRDDETNEYYYVTADARYADIMSRRYGACISFNDLAQFEDVPCRKLVVLDTCHSGAIQSLSQAELKSALRALQNDVVFTLTATEGGKEAVEANPRQMSLFTYWLLRGLQGEADRGAAKDGIVSFAEVASYVREQVPADPAAKRSSQFPTVGPMELLPYVELPLTKARVARQARR